MVTTSHRHNDRWSGRGRPIAWPPRSTYLTPMDFLLWGHIQALIYTSVVDSEEDLITLIVEAAATIWQQPGIFKDTRQSLLVAVHNIYSKFVRNTILFPECLSGFARYPSLVRPNLTVRSAARTHLRHTVP
jgi:hypothetical protein